MSKISSNRISLIKTSIKNNRKIFSIGLVLCLFVLLIITVGLQFIPSDGTIRNQDSNLETEIQMDNTENNSADSTQNDSTILTNDNNQQEETIESTDNNQSDDQTDIEQNENTQPSNSNSGSSSYTPSNNNGGGNSNPDDSDSDESATENDEPNEDDEDNTSTIANCLVNLPDSTLKAKVTLTMNEAYFITNLTQIYEPSDISNGTYSTWCIDYGQYMSYNSKNVTLFSSYCPPDVYQKNPDNWSAVNYILNNKPENVSYYDIQTAIWYYINFGSNPPVPTSIAWDIINDVGLNNGSNFIPKPGEIIAIIVESELEYRSDQLSIIELLVPEHPSISLNKTVNITTGEISDTIKYSYNITNTGDVTIYELILTDDKIGIITLPNTIIQPGESIIQTTNYTITETDLPSPVINIALAEGKTSHNQSVCAIDNESVNIVYSSEIELEKQGNVSLASIGEQITYSYNVTNTGDVTIYELTLTDDKLGTITLPNTIIQPGKSIIQTINYTITETDLPGPLVNIAEIIGVNIINDTVYDTDSFLVEIGHTSSINLDKVANTNIATLGSVVNYSYCVKNTGDVSVHDIQLCDDKLGPISLSATSLAPNEWVNASVMYTVTCADVQNDTLVNIAQVDAITILNESVSDQSTEEIILSYQPDISIAKTVFDDKYRNWKNEITIIEENLLLFNITITNTGREELHNILIRDSLPDQLCYANNASMIPLNNSSNSILWEITHLDVNESIRITYNAIATLIGSGENNASAIVDLCGGTLVKCDMVNITVLPCPSEVWVKSNWLTQHFVDIYNPSLTLDYDAYDNIQDAVKNVCSCGVVHVLNGVYREQILINKDVYLYGESSVVLRFPDTLRTFSINGSGAYSPIIFAFGGTLQYCDVTGLDTIGVLIDGFTIEGNFENNSIGILYHNVETKCAPSKIINCSIQNINTAIMIDGCSQDSTILNNTIDWIDHTIGKVGIVITKSNYFEPDNIQINHNYIGSSCGNNIGVWNKIDQPINATLNWWGSPDGPNSPLVEETFDYYTRRIADGVGTKVIGNLSFDPWAGIDALITASETNVTTYDYVLFESRDSFACRINGSYFPFYSLKWDFGDDQYSFKSNPVHRYSSSGTYDVTFLVKAIDMNLWPSFMIDIAEMTIKVH